MLTKPPLVIDNCTMSNLLSGQAFYLLKELYANNIIIPSEVYVEALKYPPLRDELAKAIEKEKWMELYIIEEIEDLKNFAQISKRAGPGEAAVMVVAKKWEGTAGSDNLRDIVRYCKKHNVPILGTMGILYDAYKKSIIDISTGDGIVLGMLNDKRKIPPTIRCFNDILDWFERGQGVELY